MNLVIYEDYEYDQFYPISLSQAIFEIKCGIFSLGDKIKYNFKNYNLFYLIRNYLKPIYSNLNFINFENYNKSNEEYLFIKANILINSPFNLDINEIALVNNEIVAFKLNSSNLKKIDYFFFFDKNRFKNFFKINFFKKRNIKAKIINYLFNLVSENINELKVDLKTYEKCYNNHINKKNIIKTSGEISGKLDKLYISLKSKIYPGVYFITEEGPIIIDSEVVITPNSIIEGPCYIGKKTLIDRAYIRKGTSIFKGCKIGGEVENCIFSDFTNKHHEGFLGHSYIGSFVNFGASSNNSNLKNNYSEVKLKINDQIINSHLLKIGCFIGDHSKLGIGSLINTGTIIGFGCNLFFEGKMYPKEIKSFSWGGANPFKIYDFTRFIKMCHKVLNRRKLKLDKEKIKLYQKLFNENK